MKKIIFWLTNDLTYFGLAYSLQKKYDFQFFGILDVTSIFRKFFESQNFVKFEEKWFFHDNVTKQQNQKPDIQYLRAFEKKYGINLWKLVFNERNFFKRSDRIQEINEIYCFLEQECRLFEKIINEVKPDFFLAKAPWFFEYRWNYFHHLQLFQELCTSNSITNMILSQPHLGRKSIISQKTHRLDFFNNLDNIKDGGRDFKELQDYLKTFDLSKQNKEYLIRHKKQILKSQNSWVYSYKTDQNKIDKKRPFDKIIFSLQTSLDAKRRATFINNKFKKQIDKNEKFVYFPLSVSNEREILLSAPFYTNQTEVIRHVAKSLPVGFKLYVKEHPSQKSHYWRRTSEYKEIMNIPNVRLFHPSVSADIFYENCSLTITISGSSAFEASFYKKPSIIFSDLGYSLLPSVHVVTELENLPRIIRSALETEVNANDLDKYISLLEKNSFDFDSHEFADKQFEYFLPEDFDNLDIINKKMKKFLQENLSIFDKLALEHIKKIEQYEIFKNHNKMRDNNVGDG